MGEPLFLPALFITLASLYTLTHTADFLARCANKWHDMTKQLISVAYNNTGAATALASPLDAPPEALKMAAVFDFLFNCQQKHGIKYKRGAFSTTRRVSPTHFKSVTLPKINHTVRLKLNKQDAATYGKIWIRIRGTPGGQGTTIVTFMGWKRANVVRFVWDKVFQPYFEALGATYEWDEATKLGLVMEKEEEEQVVVMASTVEAK